MGILLATYYLASTFNQSRFLSRENISFMEALAKKAGEWKDWDVEASEATDIINVIVNLDWPNDHDAYLFIMRHGDMQPPFNRIDRSGIW